MCGGGGGSSQDDYKQRKTNITRQAEQDMISQVQRGREIRRTVGSVMEEAYPDNQFIRAFNYMGPEPAYMTQEEAQTYITQTAPKIQQQAEQSVGNVGSMGYLYQQQLEKLLAEEGI